MPNPNIHSGGGEKTSQPKSGQDEQDLQDDIRRKLPLPKGLPIPNPVHRVHPVHSFPKTNAGFTSSTAQTIVGGKWLCVVVKYGNKDAFVVTACLTDKPKAGEDLWPKK